MEKVKRRLNLILVLVVLTAIVIGVIYYVTSTGDDAVLSRGTLI